MSDDELDDLMTAERLAEMANVEHAELVEGMLVAAAPPGFSHGRIAATIARVLGNYAAESGTGDVVVESGFILERRPDTVRTPDVAFVRAERFGGTPPPGFAPFPPDLAVEIASPADALAALESKVDEYIGAGCEAVWVVNPQKQRVMEYLRGGAVRVFGPSEEIEGRDLLPGFRCTVRDLFPKFPRRAD